VVEFGGLRRYVQSMAALRPLVEPVRLDLDTGWMQAGNCRNHPASLFFPRDGTGVEAARQVCSTCPVRQACLDYAIDHRIEHGVWGGTSERARRRILRARQRGVE
jgi:WhiB family redox-sensing transcriptional regulator